MSALRGCAAVLALLWLALAPLAHAQTIETNLMQEVISREYSVHIGGIQTPEYKDIVSREFSVFVGVEPSYRQVVSREVSIVVTTPAVPARVAPLIVTATPTGETVTLSWAGYNHWAQRDVAGYRIYLSDRPFTDVSGMTNFVFVPGEVFTFTFTNLTAWQDHYFAVVAVDALGGFNPEVNYAAAYILAKEVVSRECSMFVGAEPPWQQVVSREVSVVVTTPQVPAQVTNLVVTPTPSGETVQLSWAGYNQWAERDVALYHIYLGTHGFTDVSHMTPFATVRGETFSLTLSNLTAWEDHFFAVVPVDALGGSNAVVQYAAAYIIAKEVVSRECSVFVGAESAPYREVVSREVSLVVSTPDVPDKVTCLDCGFLVRDSVNAFTGLDLDWTAYNEVGQKDVVRYDIYLGPAFFTSVTGLEPFARVPAETKRATLTGLVPYGVYYVAVVAVDVNGHRDPEVRSQSAQASVDRVREVQNLAAGCGTDSLTFNWQPPDGADPRSNNLLVAYSVTLGTNAPVLLDRWATSYTATDLLPGHGYPFVVQTVDNSNRVSEGASVLAATLMPNPAQTVANSFYGITRVAWEWLEPDAVIDRFLVYMAETNFTSVAGMTPAQSTRGHSADFHLVSGKTYWFAVTTRNIGGCDSTGLPIRVVAHTPGGTTDPTVLEPGGYTNGVFSIVVNGPVGAEYVLQGSENLRQWVPLQTNAPAAMPYAVTVTNVPGLNRFYRVVIQ